MLRNLRVANHRSIRGVQELSMLPVYEKDRAVTPVAGIFGANASGKTAFVGAFEFMRSAVIDSYRLWDPEGGIPRTPFKLDISSLLDPSSFSIEIEIDGIQYIYGFEINDESVAEEWLYSYPESRKRIIFERHYDHIKVGSTVPDYRSRASALNQFMRNNALLLPTAMQSLKQPEVAPVYRWFASKLRVQSAQAKQFVNEPALARSIRRRPGLARLLRAADVGITNIRVEDIEMPVNFASERLIESLHTRLSQAEMEIRNLERQQDQARSRMGSSTDAERGEHGTQRRSRDLETRLEKEIANRNELQQHIEMVFRRRRRSRVFFAHGDGDMELGLNEESDGTVAWLSLMVATLDVLNEGGVLVVDEIDSSLHPKLTAHLVEAFQDAEMNPRNAQLIFTTHDSTLLGPAFGSSNLDRDEVWFVEKDTRGETSLFPLSDFQPRKEDNIERRYLHGGYGGTPRTDQFDMYKALMDARMLASKSGDESE